MSKAAIKAVSSRSGDTLYKIKEGKNSGSCEQHQTTQPAVRSTGPASQPACPGTGAAGTPSPPAVPGRTQAGCLVEASRGHARRRPAPTLVSPGPRPSKVLRHAADLALGLGTPDLPRRGGGSHHRLTRKEVTAVSQQHRHPDISLQRHHVALLLFSPAHSQDHRWTLRDKAPPSQGRQTVCGRWETSPSKPSPSRCKEAERRAETQAAGGRPASSSPR